MEHMYFEDQFCLASPNNSGMEAKHVLFDMMLTCISFGNPKYYLYKMLFTR